MTATVMILLNSYFVPSAVTAWHTSSTDVTCSQKEMWLLGTYIVTTWEVLQSSKKVPGTP